MEEKLGRYANELAEVKGLVGLAGALLQPEPHPAEVALALVTEASNCERGGRGGAGCRRMRGAQKEGRGGGL